MIPVKDLALESGLAVASITTAEPFDGLAETIDTRVLDGHLAGMDWFTPERSIVSANPRMLHATAQSIISVGIPYFRSDIVPPDDGVLRGQIARYAWGRDYHVTLKQRMESFRARLETEVGRPIEARLLVDTARIVDRAVAARSGLGWYGKHTNIIVPHHGSFVMLGELIVDLELIPDVPLNRSCGSCAICLSKCPTQAIVAPYVVDAPKCISFQTIEQRGPIPFSVRDQMGSWIFGCDVCQTVCPYTGAAREMFDDAFAPDSLANSFPSLHWLLKMGEEEFRQTYRGTAVLRAKRRGLARNAAVAIGNTGSADDLNGLAVALSTHDEPVVRGHVAWAIGKTGGSRGHDILMEASRREIDQLVISECRHAMTNIEGGTCVNGSNAD